MGLSLTAGALITGCKGKLFVPPSVEGLFGVSETLTLASQRLLLTKQSMAREFSRDSISAYFPAINTVNPDDVQYQEQRSRNFRDWRLPVKGLVANPLSLSLSDLRAMPAHSQVTQHSCERGWSAIAEWTGVQLAHVLSAARMSAAARWIVFECVDGWWDSLDLFDALHPQTLLAYGMNGGDLPLQHGAPLRLRVERYLGWKQLKYLSRITVMAALPGDKRRGSGGIDYGFPWYAGI